jgi:hypothetical protein
MHRLFGIGSTILGTLSIVCLALGILATTAVRTSYAVPIGPCALDVNTDTCKGTCPIPLECQDNGPLKCACK